MSLRPAEIYLARAVKTAALRPITPGRANRLVKQTSRIRQWLECGAALPDPEQAVIQLRTIYLVWLSQAFMDKRINIYRQQSIQDNIEKCCRMIAGQPCNINPPYDPSPIPMTGVEP